ncbi:MAG: hypothetical protein ACK5C9_08610 [Pseudanabaena sp.]|jgi:hypothetical protein
MNPEEKNLTTSEIKPTSKQPNEIGKDETQEKNNIELDNEKDILPNLIQFNAKGIVPNLDDKEFNLQASQETTRSQLATLLVSILSRTIIASFSLVVVLLIMSIFIDEKKTSSFDKTSALVKDLITLILTAQIGLVGTALGFYFGSKGNSD